MFKRILKGAAAAALIFDTCVAVSLCMDEIRIRLKHTQDSDLDYQPSWFEEDDEEDSCNKDSLPLVVEKDAIRDLDDASIGGYVIASVAPAAGSLFEALSLRDQLAVNQLLLAIVDYLRAKAPIEEQNFTMLLEILTAMRDSSNGEKSAVDYLMEGYEEHQTEAPQYFREYCNFKQLAKDKDSVIHVCIVAVAAIVQELYGEITTVSLATEA